MDPGLEFRKAAVLIPFLQPAADVDAVISGASGLQAVLLGTQMGRTAQADLLLGGFEHLHRGAGQGVDVEKADQPAMVPVVDDPNSSGQTPVHVAAIENQVEMLSSIGRRLDGEADAALILNARDTSGSTPLTSAVSQGCHDSAQMLANLPGVDRETRDKERKTPYHLAIEAGDERMLDILCGSGGLTPELRKELLSWTVDQNRQSLADRLLDKRPGGSEAVRG